MAVYPINMTTSHRLSPLPDTGESAFWRQMANLGATITDVGSELFIKQAEDKFTDAKFEYKKAELAFEQSLEENLDESTYQSQFDKFVAGTVRLSPKGNNLASKLYSDWSRERNLTLKEAVDDARRLRLADKWEAKLDKEIEDAIRTGNMSGVREKIYIGGRLGYIDENTAGDIIRKAEHDAQRGIVERIALSSNPELFLDKYETFQELEKDYPDLTPGDFQDLRAIAQGQQRNKLQNQYEQQNAVKNEVIDKIQAHDLNTAEFIKDNILDADERYTWLRRYNEEMKRFVSGDVIITDQRFKHEILDYAAAINWPDKHISVQAVLDRANEARYPSDGSEPKIDDSAYDEIRDSIRREMEDKPPFTQSYIEKGIGELMTGAPSSMLGIPLPTLRTREDYMKHATNLFGRYITKIPGVMETINAKFPPDIPPKRKEEVIDNPAHDFDGEIIGSYNPDGSITLNRLGVRRLYELAGMDIQRARRMALENRYFIPGAD